ncbi:hypothetical protein YC2023_018386 [Brassica napus]
MKTLSKPEVANMAKWRATRDATSDEKCNKIREQREKRRLHKISKLWSHPRPNLRKKRTNIDQNNVQHHDKQPHN